MQGQHHINSPEVQPNILPLEDDFDLFTPEVIELFFTI